jgi:hypothetical protein
MAVLFAPALFWFPLLPPNLWGLGRAAAEQIRAPKTKMEAAFIFASECGGNEWKIVLETLGQVVECRGLA